MLPPLRLLIDRAGDGVDLLSPDLATWYGGALRLPEPVDRPVVVGNFVQSIDGVVRDRSTDKEPLFGDLDDRLLMSLLRLWSDVVVVGRRTVDAGSKRATWHWRTTAPKEPSDLLPLLSALELERRRAHPHTEIVVTRSARDIGYDRAIFHDKDLSAVLLTTRAGATRARRDIAAASPTPGVELWELERDGGVDFAAALERLHASGRGRVLVEGGPEIYGEFESRGLIDELFLTLRGVVAGTGPELIPSFSAHAYAPGERPELDLRSLRASENDVLFSRWRYRR
jgi:5-amino-6-(5-phosphoribosylamino)uracil reductase